MNLKRYQVILAIIDIIIAVDEFDAKAQPPAAMPLAA